MTEDEAKTKWCPFVRQSAQAAHSNRGDHPNAGNVNCIGSQCMAWRTVNSWSLADWVLYKKMNDENKAKFSPPKEDQGFCGLAGDSNRLVYMPPMGIQPRGL